MILNVYFNSPFGMHYIAPTRNSIEIDSRFLQSSLYFFFLDPYKDTSTSSYRILFSFQARTRAVRVFVLSKKAHNHCGGCQL